MAHASNHLFNIYNFYKVTQNISHETCYYFVDKGDHWLIMLKNNENYLS